MAGYTKLFSSIIHSTVWQESAQTKVLWVTMLAMVDRDGCVMASLPGLARASGLSIDETEESLRVLSEPDQYSRTPDMDGRRIFQIDGGWALVNYEKYRDLESEVERKEKQAARQRASRANREMSQPVTEKCDMSHLSRSVTQCHTSCDMSQNVTNVTPATATASSTVTEERFNKIDRLEDGETEQVPSSPPADDVICLFPCDGKIASWALTRRKVEEWQLLYPSIDVLAECRKALAWVGAAPGRRKTAGGTAKYLVGWLNRATDSRWSKSRESPHSPKTEIDWNEFLWGGKNAAE